MAGNTLPIFSKAGAMTVGIGATNALGVASYRTSSYTGTSATLEPAVFTADGTNGSFVQRLRFKSKGTNAVSVARIWINNGADETVATNNAFYGEISLPAVTSSSSAATVDVDYPINFALPAGYKIKVGVSAAADLASGWTCMAVAGNY